MKRLLVLSLVVILLLSAIPTAFASKVTVPFWYAVGGNAGRVFQEMVDEFNATNPRVFVDAVYTGNYGDTAQKVTASIAANTLPAGGLIPAAPLFTGRNGNYLIDEYLHGPHKFQIRMTSMMNSGITTDTRDESLLYPSITVPLWCFTTRTF